jgi:hypothetical protein
MEKQEYLFIPDETDREFAEMDGKISAVHPEYAAVPEEKRRVAYFLVSRIGTQKMPEIAQMAKVSTGKCYELIKEPDCRIAQSFASDYLRVVQQRKLLDEINYATCKMARLAREKKLTATKFTEIMRRVARAAEPSYQLTPVEFYYLDINMTAYLAENSIKPDQQCLDAVKTKLEEIEHA